MAMTAPNPLIYTPPITSITATIMDAVEIRIEKIDGKYQGSAAIQFCDANGNYIPDSDDPSGNLTRRFFIADVMADAAAQAEMSPPNMVPATGIAALEAYILDAYRRQRIILIAQQVLAATTNLANAVAVGDANDIAVATKALAAANELVV